MQLALEHTNSVTFEIDCTTDEVIRHGAYSDFFELEPDAAPTWTEHLKQAVHPDDRDKFNRFYREITDGNRDRGELEHQTHPEMGDVNWIRDTVFIEDGSDSQQTIGIARDEISNVGRDR